MDSDDESEPVSDALADVAVPGETWKQPRHNFHRTLAALYSFTVLGANGGAYGALIPYLRIDYNLSYTAVSLIFLPNLVGSLVAATFLDSIHRAFGQRGIAIIGPTCQVISYAIIAGRPAFPIVVFFLCLVGFGGGIQDGAWNAWVGDMASASQILGVLHGLYGFGAILGPLIVTLLIAKANLQWFFFYYFMVAASLLCLITSALAFWESDGPSFRALHSTIDYSGVTDTEETSSPGERLLSSPHRRRIITITTFYIICVSGVEVALGGWIVTYMLQVRHADALSSGMVATGFWGGYTVGRIILGFVTPHLGVRRAITTYVLCATVACLVFWLIPNFYVCAIAVSLQGAFIGPLYPMAVIVLARLLPKHFHVSALALVTSCGALGATMFPFAVGALAETVGVWVLPPVLLVLLAVSAAGPARR